MKPTRSLLSFLFGSVFLTAQVAQAATYYWDGGIINGGDPAANANGGAGNWDNTLTNWDTLAAAGADSAWIAGSTAVFSGTGATVTLTDNITVGGLTFNKVNNNTTYYTLDAGANTLSFASGDNTLLFANGNGGAPSATITGQLAGTGANVIVSAQSSVFSGGGSAGTLTLNGTSTGGWTGTTTINHSMTLSLAAANRGLSSTSGITLNSGAIVSTNVDATQAAYDRFNDSAGITINGGGSFTYTNTKASARVFAETLGAVTLNSGQFNAVLTNDQNSGGGNVQTLTLGSASNNVSGSGLARTTTTSAVTFSAGTTGPNATTNRIAVYGAGTTTAGQIVGPWATTGTAAATQTDYAIYSGGYVTAAGASLTTAAESGWGSTTDAYQFGTAQTLTADRSAAALRYTAAANPLALASFTLKTNGILNGGSGLLTVSGLGALTATGNTGGNLFLTTGSSDITISSKISDNGGAVSVVKSGGTLATTRILTLSGNNDFTGGIVVNEGTLRLSGAQSFTGGVILSGGAFGDSTDGIAAAELNSNSVTVNGNASMYITSGETLAGAIAISSTGNLKLNGPTATLSGVVSGSGVLTITGTSGPTVTLSNTANTHTGVISMVNDNNQNLVLNVNSLADSAAPGAGNIQMGGGAAGGGYTFALHSAAIAPLILNNRQVELAGDGYSAAMPNKLFNNSTQAFTINSNLLASGTNAKTLTLGGSGTGLSTFAGTITNGSLTTLNLTKESANNIWALTNAASSYNGVTTISGGTLQVSSLANGGSNSSIGASTNAAGNLILNGGTLQYTGGAVSTDRLFSLQFTGTSTIDSSGTGAVNFNNTGAMGFNGGTGAKTLALTGSNTGNNTIAAVIGNNTGTTGITKSGVGTWVLSGANTYTGATSITNGTLSLTGSLGATVVTTSATGVLNQSAAGVIGSTGSVVQSSALTSILAGTNTYTGVTTVTAGILQVTGSTAAGSAVTVSGGAIGGTGTIGGSLSLTTAGGINLANGSVGGTPFTVSGTLASTGLAGTNNMIFDLASGGTTTDQIVASGAFNMTTAGAVVVSVNQLGGSTNRLTAGTYNILTAASGTALTAGGGNFQLATTKAFGQTFSLANTTTGALRLTTTQVTGAVLASTTLGGSTPWWTDVTKFSGGALPDYMSNVIINSAIGTNNLQASQNINSLTYGTSATTGTTIQSGTTAAGTPFNMLVIEAGTANGNTSGNGITLNNTNGSHTISANIGLASTQTWTLAAGSTLTVSGGVSDFGGNYGLTKAGGGRLIFSGANTYTGDTVASSGYLRIGNSSGNSWGVALSNASNLAINNAIVEAWYYTTRSIGTGAGQFQFTGGRAGLSNLQGDASAAWLTLTNTPVWGSASFNPSTFVLNDSVGGTVSVAQLRLVGNIDLNGAARTVEVSATGVGAGSRGSYATIEGILSGSGASLVKTGVGTLMLNGVNTYSSGTTINQGGLWFDKTVSMPNAGAVTVNDNGILSISVGNTGGWTTGTSGNGTIGGLLAGLGGQAGSTVSYVDDVQVGFNVTGTQTYSGNITDVGTSLGIHIGNKDGGTSNDPFATAGTLTLSGNNSYTGGISLNQGTLSVGSATAVPSTGTITFNHGTIQSSDSTARSFANTIAVTGNITVGGTGNMTFSNTGTVALGTSRTFTINGGTTTFAQSFTGATFTLTKAGAGTLTLTGNNTGVTGGTTLTGGTLVLSGANALPAGAITFSTTNTTLQFQSDSNLSVTNALTTAGRSLNRTIVADRVTSGAATNLTFTALPNTMDCGTVLNFQAGANVTSGTPTITFSGGLTSSDSNNGTIAGGTGANGAIRFNPTGVNVVISSINGGGRTRGYIFDGTSTGNQVTGVINNGTGTEIEKRGTGTWTLSGNNTYALNTSVTAGTLIANHANALGTGGTRNVSVAAGATLNYAAVANANLSITGTLGITGGTNTAIGGSIGSTLTGAQIAVTGIATISDAAHSVNVYGISGITTGTTGTYTLINGGAGSSLNPATVPTLGKILNNTNFLVNLTGGDGGTSPFVRTPTTLGVAVTSQAAITSAFWTGGLSGSTNVWAVSDGTANSNWVTAVGGGATGVVPGSGADVTIGGATVVTAPTATVLGASMSIRSLTISDTTNGLGLLYDANTLTIANAAGITMSASVPASSIGANVALGANQTWTNNSANALTVRGDVSGAFNLSTAGTGTIVLDGLNTYSGTTTIGAGNTLQIGAAGRLTAGTYSQTISIGAGGIFRYSGNNAQTLSGAITGAGGITKDTNTSDLTLSSVGNNYTGTTTVSAGRILATAVTHLSSGATSIVQSGTGQVYLNAAATFSNPFNLSGPGYLEIGDSQNNVDGAIRLDNTSNLSGTITLSGNSRISKFGNTTSTISGQITGGFGIDFYGFQNTASHAPTFVLSNTNNNYTGATTIYNSNYNTTNLAGVSTTLKLGASNVIPDGSSAGNVAFAVNGTNNNATVIFDLNGFNETINGLTVNAGTFATRITNTAAAANSVLTIGANNTTSSFNGTITDSGAGRTLAVTKTGNGVLTLSGANTYIGATTVSQGTLRVNGSTAASSTVTVSAAGTLGGTGAIAGAVNVTGQLSPGASIETLGTGALSLLNGSTLVHELDSSVATSAGSDLLKVAGNLALTGAVGLTLEDLAVSDVAFADNDVFSLINYTGTWNSGLFTFSGNELSDEEVFAFGLNTWKISYDDAAGGLNYSGEFAGGGDSFVNLTVVSTIPEPGAVFLGSMGLLLILRRRR